MSTSLTVRNLVPGQPLDPLFLRRVVRFLLQDLLRAKVREVGIYVVGPDDITGLNEIFLRHRGVTDVITFNYAENSQEMLLHGEIFVCVDEARIQAARFGVSWQAELVRYVVHGILHLLDYDDRRKAARVRMKRKENRILQQLADRFPLEALGRSR